MNKLKLWGLALMTLVVGSAKADEGMWLLQLMQQQNSIDMMKKQGLKLEANDLYNPNGISLKDAVGIFGGGCTGEIISPEGLILTNHHCGYASIQQHSSVEHDYLTDGFWATSRDKELPTPGLKFTFIERIEDITDLVNQKIESKEITEAQSFTTAFLNKLAKELCEKSDLNGKPGIVPQALPFYAGNKFYMFYKKVYPDVRMVAAPPSSVGKFGGETDNWMWPRHTGDFSMFRIYADANGEPAEYSASNVPLKTKKHLAISLKGLKEGDYAMIMGFPGSTSRYLTVSEVKERMNSTNEPRIRIRTARLNVLKEVMNASDKTRIQYANKYAGSSNYWKNSIGMNKAIIDNDVLGTKEAQEERFAKFAKEKNNPAYMNVVKEIDDAVAITAPLVYQATCLTESFFSAIEFGSPYQIMEKLEKALEEKNDSAVNANIKVLENVFASIHNKDYDHEVDRKVAKVLFPLYAEMIPAEQRPAFYSTIEKEYKGDYKQLGEDDILVIEGIHGLNDKLSYTLPKESKFKIYISALTQINIDEHNRISTTDGRLIRRMVRDARTRGASAARTIGMWPSVRRGEDQYIFPFQEEADVMFNSALIYELAVLKPYAEAILFGIPKDAPEYIEAKRLLKFLDYFIGISSEDIPKNSLMREFVGGSVFNV